MTEGLPEGIMKLGFVHAKAEGDYGACGGMA